MLKKKYSRKSVRFTPDPGLVAQICFSPKTKTFKAEYSALILSESYRGCSLLIALAPDIAVADRLQIKVGELGPLLAEARWVIQLDEHIQKVGFMYLQ